MFRTPISATAFLYISTMAFRSNSPVAAELDPLPASELIPLPGIVLHLGEEGQQVIELIEITQIHLVFRGLPEVVAGSIVRPVFRIQIGVMGLQGISRQAFGPEAHLESLIPGLSDVIVTINSTHRGSNDQVLNVRVEEGQARVTAPGERSFHADLIVDGLLPCSKFGLGAAVPRKDEYSSLRVGKRVLLATEPWTLVASAEV